MTIEQIATILWRRRLSFAIAFLAFLAIVIAVTVSLPRVYTSTATLFVGGRVDPQSFIDTGLVEQHTRTYATLAANPNIADIVARELPMELTRSQLLDRMSFAPVERTPLLQISAEGDSPEDARLIATTYAETFVRRMTDLFERGKTPAEISISEGAVLPTSPSKPNPPLYIGFGVLLSIILGLAVALVRERVDTRVRVAPEDDSVLGQPIMALIPRLDGRDGRASREAADRFGLLKTNLDFFDESPARVIVVTSPGVSEGKSTVSSNLALACAADGERVVLIEADLRRPGLDATPIADRVGRSPVGLSNYLAGAATEEQIITAHPDHPELAVVWSGLIPPNPTALLGSHRLDTLVNTLRLEYDRVIIDTCPISVGADASVIASRVDGALYIMDERKTKRTEAQAGLNQLRSVRAKLLGVVLNRAGLAGAEAYYYRERGADERVPAGEPGAGSAETFS